MLAYLGECNEDQPCPEVPVPEVINLGPDTPIFKATGTGVRVCGVPWFGKVNNCLVVALAGITLVALLGSTRK